MIGSVLVIEDDHDLREALLESFLAEGVVAAGAASAESALRMLRGGFSPAVILLDLLMPKLDGVEFRRIQLSQPELAKIPVVVLSGDVTHVAEIKKLGVSFVVRKPAAFEEILTVLIRAAASRI